MNARAMIRLLEALPNDPLAITVSAFTATIDYTHRALLLSRALGVALKLPKANGSGTLLQVVVGIVPTTTPFHVVSAASGDAIQGSLGVQLDASTAEFFKTVASATVPTNTITLNGTTTGGVTVGDSIFLRDIQPNVWAVWGSVIGSGSIATPFSRV